MTTRPMAALNDVGQSFRPVEVLHGVNLALHTGKQVNAIKDMVVEGIEDIYVAFDISGFGTVLGTYMASQMPYGGNIVVFRGIPTTIDNERIDAFTAAIEGSGINVLDMEHGNWNCDESFTVTQDFLSKYPNIDAVWASNDDMAIGVLAVIEAADRGTLNLFWVVLA